MIQLASVHTIYFWHPVYYCRKTLWLLFAVWLLAHVHRAVAQTDNYYLDDIADIERCGTADAPDWARENGKPYTYTPTKDPIIIPVVFHVFHAGGKENLSREDLVAALARTNDDLARKNSRFPLSPPLFRAKAADMNVKLWLATVDPNGNCTDGIVRYYTPLADRTVSQTDGKMWDKNKYMNVIVSATLHNGYRNPISGSAFYPDQYDDRISVIASVLTSIVDSLHNGYDNVLTHEVGHWMGLQHIWGHTNDTSPTYCNEDDGISDTPLQSGPSYACFSDYPVISCDNGPQGNMFVNFMDYGFCRTMFTEGQKQFAYSRYLQRQSGSRAQIHHPANIIATAPQGDFADLSCPGVTPIADFAADERFLSRCSEEMRVIFHERSFRAKPTAVIRWFFPGGTPNRGVGKLVAVRYPAAGEYTVMMIAANAAGADTMTRTVRVGEIPPAPADPTFHAYEDFEAATTLSDVGDTFHFLGNLNWELFTGAGYQSRQCLRLHTFSDFRNYVNAFYRTRRFKTTLNDSTLSFRLAYADGDPDNYLRIWAVAGCDLPENVTFLKLFTNEELRSVPSANRRADFQPTGPDEWKELTVTIPKELRGREDLHFIFRFKHHVSNSAALNSYANVYLDDLRISSQLTTAAPEAYPPQERFRVYPNPASGRFFVTAMQGYAQPIRVTLYDLHGQIVQQTVVRDVTAIPTPAAAGGVYIVVINDVESGQPLWRERLVVQ